MNDLDSGAQSRRADERARTVLVVDLDGSLTPCHTLRTTLFRMLTRNPFLGLRMLVWLCGGLPAFKARIAQRAILDPATLAYHPEVLGLIEEARSLGQSVVLCSASHQRQVDAVAAHLGVFDEHFGSSQRNLRGPQKAAFLSDRYQERGYRYVGDSRHDLPVWAQTRGADGVIAVAVNPFVRHMLRARHAGARHLDRHASRDMARPQLLSGDAPPATRAAERRR